jgi:adenosylcobinamide-phosphate synthase
VRFRRGPATVTGERASRHGHCPLGDGKAGGECRSGSQDTPARVDHRPRAWTPGGRRDRCAARAARPAACRCPGRRPLRAHPPRPGPLRAALNATAAGLLAAGFADALLGDPRRLHPVAGFGRAAAGLERRTWADARTRGALHVGLLVGAAVAAGIATQRLTRRPAARTVAVAAAGWAVLGGTSLHREADRMAAALRDDDVAAARARLGHLCGRDPAALDADGLARATVESLAENTSDAVVAPLFWGAVAGLPGLLGYRAVNTLDAMVGHRSPRYARFGWAAARLDDAANLVPARLCAALTVAVAPLVGADPAGAWRAWRADGGNHPSPNGGRCEAAVAGALGVRLGGTNVYAGRVEHRGVLHSAGRPVTPADIAPAARLCTAVGAAAVLASAALAAGIRR